MYITITKILLNTLLVIDIVRKFYLVDGGYLNIIGFLIPYQRHRYYLSKFNTLDVHTIKIVEELFNHMYSLHWKVIERIFGLLKGRFSILKM